jgi:hypothetical protein
VARGSRFLIAALVPLALALAVAAVSATGADGPRTRVVLLVVRDDGVWRVRADDGRATRIPGIRGAVAAAWAPNGRELAFERAGSVYGANGDGSGIRVLISGGDPSWSPDGRRLAVVQSGRIVVARRNGRSPRAITTGPGDGRPSWSPDGARIAFVRDGTISVVAASGGAVTALARGSDPDWSPDGRRIAFAHEAGGIATTTPDGSDLRLLTLDGGAATPVWVPDASEVVVVQNENIVAYASDGTASRPLGPGLRVHVGRVPVAAERLPDLDQRAPRRLSVATIGGRHKLGFDSAVDSVGEGPLWIRGVRTGREMQARQLVRLAGGDLETNHDAGTLRYTWSSSHSHWHLVRFARYELRRADDRSLLVTDRKTGFCLADHYGTAARARPSRPVFLGNCAAGAPGARTIEQGSSVGFTDRYPAHFHGQNVDLTGIRPGVYVLVHRANPDGLLRERRYDNNAASVRLRLTRPGGAPHVQVLRTCEGTERC